MKCTMIREDHILIIGWVVNRFHKVLDEVEQDSRIINNDDKLRIDIHHKLVECLSFGFSPVLTESTFMVD